MDKKIIAIAIAGSMAISLSAFANKGAEYHAPHHKHHDNLDWSKGWYIGAGVNGNAQATMGLNGSPKVFDHYFPNDFVTEYEQTTSDVGFDAYIGRQVSRHWAVELGYTWLGNQFFEGEYLETEVIQAEVQQWNAHLVGIGKLPIGEYFNVLAKAGAAYFSSEQEFTFTDGTASATDTTHTMALTYGAGIEVAWDNWGIRGEYNVIWPANNVEDDFYIADIISANIYYKFN
jgi:opacity protein-like surface antigen